MSARELRRSNRAHKPPVRLGQSIPRETIKSVKIKLTEYLPKLSNPAITPSSSTMGNNCSCDRINIIQKQVDDLENPITVDWEYDSSSEDDKEIIRQ